MKNTEPNFDGKNIFSADTSELNGKNSPVQVGEELRLDENQDELMKKQPLENLERGFIIMPHEDEHKDDFEKDEESDSVDYEDLVKPNLRTNNSTIRAESTENKEPNINPLTNIF